MFPSIILLDNSNYCNLQCSMCDHKHMTRQKKIMDFSLYTKLIDEIAVKNPNARVWEIFFGDPFCCPDISERILYAKIKGLQDVVLNSNGFAMTAPMAKKLILCGLDAMYIGIDAATKATYDKIRIGGNFDRTISNILTYRDLLDELGLENQKLFVQFVVSEQNEHEIGEFTHFWKNERVNVKIRPKVSWGGIIDAKNLKLDMPRKACKWALNSLSVCCDGKVALCAVDLHCRVPVGDCTTQTIEEVWNSELSKYREMHNTNNFGSLPEFCKNCLDWQSAYCEYL